MGTSRIYIPVIVPPLLVGIVLWASDQVGPFLVSTVVKPFLPLAVACYLAAHIIRAMRFAVIATRIIPLRTRTLTLLHFNAAPVSLLLPLKIGELYRLQQLANGAQDLVRPVLVILVERALDAIILLGVVGVMIVSIKEVAPALLFAGSLLFVALCMAVLTISIAPPALSAFQSYVVATHFSRRMLRLLQIVDFLRRSVEAARNSLQGRLPLLICLSALIWILEASTLLVLWFSLTGYNVGLDFSPVPSAFVPWMSAEGQVGEVVLAYTALAFVSLSVVWPFATIAYIRQMAKPDWRPARPIASDTVPTSLTTIDRARTVRLFVPRRSL